MQVVIEIPEEKYMHIKEEQWLPNRLLIEKAIANGTPLPKGHGDLIDRSQALRTDCFGDGHDGLRAFHEYADYAKMRKYLESLPTIVPREGVME